MQDQQTYLSESVCEQRSYTICSIVFAYNTQVTSWSISVFTHVAHTVLPDCLRGSLPGSFLLSYLVFDFISPYFFVFWAVR